MSRAVASALIGGGGGSVYSYIRVMPDGFLLKSVVFKFISKEISRAEHEYMNIPPPPPPINALATALNMSLMNIAGRKHIFLPLGIEAKFKLIEDLLPLGFQDDALHFNKRPE